MNKRSILGGTGPPIGHRLRWSSTAHGVMSLELGILVQRMCHVEIQIFHLVPRDTCVVRMKMTMEVHGWPSVLIRRTSDVAEHFGILSQTTSIASLEVGKVVCQLLADRGIFSANRTVSRFALKIARQFYVMFPELTLISRDDGRHFFYLSIKTG